MAETQNWLYPRNDSFMLNTTRSVLTQPFAFDLLLHYFAKENRNIIVVLLDQNWNHYSAVATKCGLNLKKCQSEGRINAVDIFECTSNGSEDSFDWDLFVQDIFCKVNQLPTNSVVLIDDLSVLLSLDVTCSSIYTLVRRLRRELAKKKSTLFVASNYQHENDQLYSLITSLIYECDTWLDCDTPKSGYSLQINGIARFVNKIDGSLLEMNYKLSNRNVVFKKL